MNIEKVDSVIKMAVGSGQYVKYPDFNIQNRDYLFAIRINEDNSKGLVTLLNKIGRKRKIDDIVGLSLKYRVKDEWFPMYTLSTVERLFMVSYLADTFKKPVMLHYGFSQMRQKTLRLFMNTFKNSQYITIMCDDNDYKDFTKMEEDSKYNPKWQFEEVGDRGDIMEYFDEYKTEDIVDNMRDSRLFIKNQLKVERMNVVRSVTWSDKAYERDGYLRLSNPLNEISPELLNLLELCCRDCDYIILKEPDVMLTQDERKIFYIYLDKAKDTYKGIFLSEYV